MPAPGVTEEELADAAQLASLADETPEGRSIVVLAKQRFKLRERDLRPLGAIVRAVLRADAHERRRHRRAPDPQGRGGCHRQARRGARAERSRRRCSTSRAARSRAAAARRWWWPTAARVLGVIELKDIVKGGIKERFAELRRMGIKTIMITGDNPLTAAAIAAEAGVDDFLAEATPEAKLQADSRASGARDAWSR